MKRRILKTYLLLLVVLTTTAQDYGVTAFGTDKITSETISRDFNDELNALKLSYSTSREEYEKDKRKLEARLKEMGDFGYVNVKLFKSYADAYDFIIDFVETKDMKRRLNFRKIETLHFDDPEGLVSRWEEYQRKGYELFQDGKINDWSCPVIHCLWTFNNPELTPHLEYFNANAPANKDVLIQVLNSSDSISYRAAAAFLLAHAQVSNQELLNILLPAIHDPESEVRNNAMRVIYYICRAEPTIQLDISEVIRALDYPSFTDRNKALVILRSIPLDNLKSDEFRKLAGILMEILVKKDAHNYRNAHQVLMNMSQEDYPVESIDSWMQWYKGLN